MHAILWIVLSLGAAFVASYVFVRRAQRVQPRIAMPTGETMPTTALQRLAWQVFVPALVLTKAAAAVVAYHGADVAWDNDTVRLTATSLLLAALGVFTYYIARVRLWLMRDDGTLDERDRAILASAPAGQAPAMMVALALWMIALTERYHATHLVPLAYLYLIFWSLLMIGILATLAGVIIGYRRS